MPTATAAKRKQDDTTMRMFGYAASDSSNACRQEHVIVKTKKKSQLIRSCLSIAHWVAQQATTLLTLVLVVLLITRYHYKITLRPLFRAYRWNEANSAFGVTYYQRDCTRQDLSTTDLHDLIVQDNWDATKATENILIHGASVFPALVDRHSLQEFRNYTLQRNANLPKQDLVYVMNSFVKKKQTRWAFAFSANDHSSVPNILLQIVSNTRFRHTLELFLGPDPAVIKMQTITAIQGAEHQGWHPDLNAYSSALSYARNFMMHFSLFIPLQDTTFRMGATGIYPGTQYCTNIDKDLQKSNQVTNQVFSGYDNQTGMPIWFAGDALLMNQNTFHKGWEHSQSNAPRAVIVITFTSRPRTTTTSNNNNNNKILPMYTPLPSFKTQQRYTNDHTNTTVSSLNARNFPSQSLWNDETKLSQVETRTLSLGTPLTSFGHSLYDFWDSQNRMSTVQTTLRYLGLYKPSDAHWGWDYISSSFPRIASEGHLYKAQDLSNFLHEWTSQGGWRLWCLENILFSSVPKEEAEYGIWDVWYMKSLDKATAYMSMVLVACFFVHLLVAALVGTRACRRPDSSVSQDQPSFRGIQQHVLTSIQRLTVPVATGIVIVWFLHSRFESSALVREIQSGLKVRTAFPNMTALLPTSGNVPVSLVPNNGQRRHDKANMLELVHPERNDVLVGTRFNSLHLRIANSFLDYHTGNIQWRNLIQDATLFVDYKSYQLSSDTIQNAVVDSIIRKTRGRVLLQSIECGNFTVMTADESRRHTRRALLIEYDPLLFMLDQSARFMVSHDLFDSSIRNTPLSRIAAVVVENLRSKLFSDECGKETRREHEREFRLLPIRQSKRKSGQFVFVGSNADAVLQRSTVPKVAPPLPPEMPPRRSRQYGLGSERIGKRALDPRKLMTASRRKRR